MNEYEEMVKRHQKETNALPIHFAYTDEQFAEGMRELGLLPSDTDKVVTMPGGGYCRKEDLDMILSTYDRQKKELQEAIKGDRDGTGFIYQMFRSELADAEFGWTEDLDQFLDIECSLSRDEIEHDPALLNGLQKAVYEYSGAVCYWGEYFEKAKASCALRHAERLIGADNSAAVPDYLMMMERTETGYMCKVYDGNCLYEGKCLIDCPVAENEEQFKIAASIAADQMWIPHESVEPFEMSVADATKMVNNGGHYIIDHNPDYMNESSEYCNYDFIVMRAVGNCRIVAWADELDAAIGLRGRLNEAAAEKGVKFLGVREEKMFAKNFYENEKSNLSRFAYSEAEREETAKWTMDEVRNYARTGAKPEEKSDHTDRNSHEER